MAEAPEAEEIGKKIGRINAYEFKLTPVLKRIYKLMYAGLKFPMIFIVLSVNLLQKE